MSISLHTKYRPQAFGDVMGQDGVVASLQGALKKRSSQAFLMVGPSGTGKTTLARIAAGVVGSKGRDIMEIDGATYTGIDDMRSVTSGLMYRPFGEGAVKTIIVDECHMLSKNSWQSMLKALEEPPPWVFWFLCTTEPSRVPETIKTRCASYDLKPVPSAMLYELVAEIAAKEKIFPNKRAGKGEGIMELCAKSALGSPRQAIVNLGICAECGDRAEAADLLKTAEGNAAPVELAQLLLKRGSWAEAQRILTDLKETNPESIRQVVMRYVAGAALSAKKEALAGAAVEVLDAFGTPFPSGDGIAPVVLATGRVLLA